ncbi:SURF1 family protein [Nocardioides houyundeii]|uniref:SURF1 family cytochrome oxidase biogenesis protein n=1 Tax=Nocardioides houyundeii TaxID=2045452 RepID=UPI000C770800|nr:SURF1 family protein [Nocardioides houyundeii]
MHRLGFLVSKRWALFFVAVVVLSYVAVLLGQWQFHRLDDRRARNEVVERNENLPPAPVSEVLKVGEPAQAADEWRLVQATGTYDADDTVVVRYRTRDSKSGVQAVVPLDLPDGTTLLVDRGWWPTANRGDVPDDLPAPPSGEVTVTGWIRLDAEGDSTQVVDHSTRAIASEAIGQALDRDVLGGFIAARTESPEPATPLSPTELPELDEGPHFFYGLQWWFFGALAVFGFFYLLYDELRDRRAPTQQGHRRSARRGDRERPGQPADVPSRDSRDGAQDTARL